MRDWFWLGMGAIGGVALLAGAYTTFRFRHLLRPRPVDRRLLDGGPLRADATRLPGVYASYCDRWEMDR